MKKNLYSLLVVFLSVTGLHINAQSISFTSPTNGQVVTSTINGSTESTVRVDFSYIKTLSNDPNLIGYYIKLFTHAGTYQSNIGDGIPSQFYLGSSSYTWRIELWETYLGQGSFNKAEQTITFYVKYPVKSVNSFGGGFINVDGQQRTHGYTVNKLKDEILQVGAIDQEYYYTNYVWNQSGTNNSIWKRKQLGQNDYFIIQGATTRSYNYTVALNDNGVQIQAAMRKIVKPNFQNSFVGVGNGGVIKVNNTQYNSPTAQFNVVELNPIIGGAVGQTINDIIYVFTQWSDGSTSATKTFNPGSTTTYTASFIGKPSTANRNLTMGAVVGQPIVLYWNEHSNSNVTQYKIWRKVKHNGVMGGDVLIATKNRGTLSYIDNDYALTSGYTDDLIFYDVRPYYSVENTNSDPNWRPVYGEILFKSSDSLLTTNQQIENSLSNFPNPFNPITTINFSIKESGFVNIKVFDLIGQQVAELVNEEKEAGGYSISFNASKLPSGVYIYTIHAGSFIQTRKMLLMK